MNDQERDNIKNMLSGKKKKTARPPLLRSGSTLLDLACSGSVEGAFIPGHYYLFIGDSSSGKTYISLSLLAEASINKNFDDYDLILDDVEGGALFNKEKFFGKKLAQRLRAPRYDKKTKEPIFSTTVEEFYFHVDDANKRDRPFIYICDSMDALDSVEDSEKFEEVKEALRKGTDTSGSYGTAKARANSNHLRKVLSDIHKKKSILIIISQTRDNLGFGFQKKTRAGGKSLKFYATIELWTAVKKTLDKKVRKKSRQIGIISQIQIKKNRIQGKDRVVEVPIYHSFGIDNTGSCIQYLIDEGHWKKSNGGIVSAPEFDQQAKMQNLIQYIEDNNLESDLYEIVEEVWNDIEKACVVHRKKRY